MHRDRYLFVTGKLAEPALAGLLSEAQKDLTFDWDIGLLPINVAALATTDWIATHLKVPSETTRILIPGLCRGSTDILESAFGKPVVKGPKDYRDIPDYFKLPSAGEYPAGYGEHSIEIIAEINHAGELPFAQLEEMARNYQSQGADRIDLGCTPGNPWKGIGTAVQKLKKLGFQISVDSMDGWEIATAVDSGADLVLSACASNLEFFRNLDCEIVVIPETPSDLETLYAARDTLLSWGKKIRLDPILEPIGHGFAASLRRYYEVRDKFPQDPILMGVGNLTELTDADSSGINILLLAICQELDIQSVLTTAVINWCKTAVQELHLGRKMVHYACKNRVIPKRLEPELVTLRDPTIRRFGQETLNRLAREIKDPNFRVFAEEGLIHVMNKDMHLTSDNPFHLAKELVEKAGVDPAHAFYLGYEICKANTALTLDKNYTQDQELRWGFLTRKEAPGNHGAKETQRNPD
ncbi:MAG: dihydropteroate synthase [Gemmataceae bacterium]|nr:dihydropteroate synthase [Gemmataceae bacterium]